MKLLTHAIEPFLKNAYLVVCDQTLEAAYLDPGDEVELMLETIKKVGCRVTHILLTHAHVDHISGVARAKQASGAPIYLHRDDLPIYEKLPEQGKWLGLDYGPAPPVDHFLVPGVPIRVGQELEFQVHHTPGHSPGGVCLQMGEHLFVGDTLFAGSVGRTDLPGADPTALIRSISRVLLGLGDEKTIYPGHGPASTLGRERRTNPFLTGLNPLR
ncbi:MAG: MBL fold metallo-hydrolase [Acidobacteriota bacterium]